MALKDWFTRTKTYDCLLVDEVPDGMPVLDAERAKLPLDGDLFLDKHHGLAYTRDRSVRPVRIVAEDGKGFEDVYLIARRSGVGCGLVMVHEKGIDRAFTVNGTTINLMTDDLVLKIWTDPATAYNVLDNQGLKALVKQNLLGFEMLLIFTIGGLIGFVSYPVIMWLIGAFLGMIARILGGIF